MDYLLLQNIKKHLLETTRCRAGYEDLKEELEKKLN